MSILRAQAGPLVVIDEIHRAPSLFETLRGIIDERRVAGERSVSPLIEGSNTLIECGSSLFARIVLSVSSTKPAASTSARTDAGSIR